MTSSIFQLPNLSNNNDLSNNSSDLYQANSTAALAQTPRSGPTRTNGSVSLILVVPLLSVYLFSYILQLGFLGRGVRICCQYNAAWFFKKNQRGLILPNTRFLIALCNMLFVSIQFTDTIFLVTSALGLTLFAERYRISGFIWLTLWLSGWVLLWGMAACSVVIAYKEGGFVGRMSTKPALSKLFNTFFISGAILVTLTHMVTFGLTVANQLALSSEIQSNLSQLSGSVASATDPAVVSQQFRSATKVASIMARFRGVIRLIFYMRLAWSFLLLVLLVPLGISLIRMLKVVKITKATERLGSFQVVDFDSHNREDSKGSVNIIPQESSQDMSLFSSSSNKHVHLGSQKSGTITNVALVFLNTLIYVLIVVGFAPSLHSTQKNRSR